VEIIAEIIFSVVGWLLQLLGELFIQILGQLAGEAIGHGVREIFRKPPINPWLAAIGYAVLGAALGGLSVLVVPDLLIKTHWLRAANLVLTPLIAGLAMAGLGAWRRRHEKDVIRLETFAYGFLFAFSMACARGWWGQ
jgi:hypothetical protein